MRTFAEAQTVLKLRSVGNYTTKKEIRFPKSGDVIPAGTNVELFHSPQAGSRVYLEAVSPLSKTIRIANLYKYFRGFKKAPGIRTLQRMDSNGVVSTPTGYMVEPDGYGPDGFPSWMLVLGII